MDNLHHSHHTKERTLRCDARYEEIISSSFKIHLMVNKRKIRGREGARGRQNMVRPYTQLEQHRHNKNKCFPGFVEKQSYKVPLNYSSTLNHRCHYMRAQQLLMMQ